MPVSIEKLFYHNNLKCVVVFTSLGCRCGYVGVPPTHPLFKIGYNQDLASPELLQEIRSSIIGKKGVIDIFFWDRASSRLSLLVDVHGGLTYSSLSEHTTYPCNQFDPLWFFGFDCAHYRDAKDWEAFHKLFPSKAKTYWDISARFGLQYDGIVRSSKYVEQECRNLADQLQCIADTISSLKGE